MKTVMLILCLFLNFHSNASAGSQGILPGETVIFGNRDIGVVLERHGDLLTIERLFGCGNCIVKEVRQETVWRSVDAVNGVRVGDVTMVYQNVIGKVSQLFEDGTASLSIFKPYPCTGCSTTTISTDILIRAVDQYSGFSVGDEVFVQGQGEKFVRIVALFENGLAWVAQENYSDHGYVKAVVPTSELLQK